MHTAIIGERGHLVTILKRADYCLKYQKVKARLKFKEKQDKQ